MAIVKPFRGVRYNLEKVLLRKVITPPYDVISYPMREDFASRSPYNAVHIDLPAGGDDRYYNCGNIFRQWIEEEILVRDEKPAFYLYEQVYEFSGRQYVRSGFIGVIKLSEFGKGQVFPHEKTHSGPKVDRYELMKESRANFSSIFGLYQDSESFLAPLFNEAKKTMPAAFAIDDDKVKHSIWILDSEKDIETISRFMQDKPVFIADGHHRYETALKYRDDMRAASGDPIDDVKPYDYTMMMFCNFHDEGLKVFPTHRIIDVGSDFSDNWLLERINHIFDITHLSGNTAMDEFYKSTSGTPGSFVFLGLQGMYGLKAIKESMESVHPIYRKVNTYILQEFILKAHLNFSDERLLSKDGLHFMQTLGEIEKYRSERLAIAFILHSEQMETIREVAKNGLVMPQKSTFFYPKLATGLLFNEI